MRKLAVLPFLAALLVLPLYGETITFQDGWGPPGISVVENTDKGLVVNFSMPHVNLHSVLISGEPMTALSFPAALMGNDEDAPCLPGLGRFFALPQGAKVTYEVLGTRIERVSGLDVVMVVQQQRHRAVTVLPVDRGSSAWNFDEFRVDTPAFQRLRDPDRGVLEAVVLSRDRRDRTELGELLQELAPAILDDLGHLTA